MLYKATRNTKGTILNYIMSHPHVIKHIFNISEMFCFYIALTSVVSTIPLENFTYAVIKTVTALNVGNNTLQFNLRQTIIVLSGTDGICISSLASNLLVHLQKTYRAFHFIGLYNIPLFRHTNNICKECKKKKLLRSCQHRLIAEPAVWQKYFARLTELTNHNKTNLKN